MRSGMRTLEGKSVTIIGRVADFGCTLNNTLTVLLRNVFSQDGEFLSDHLWLRVSHDLDVLGMKGRDVIQVSGVVEAYVRDHGTIDYSVRHLRRPGIITDTKNYERWERQAFRREQKVEAR